MPACATTAPPQDCVGLTEPGVFQLSPTGVGSSGPATCLGTWTIIEISPGTFRFTPPGGEGSLSLSPGEVCLVDYLVTTLRVPTIDINPAAPGVQAGQLVCATVTNLAIPVRNCSSGMTTVFPAQPNIVTVVNAPAPQLGGTSTDTATLLAPSGVTVPPAVAPTGTVNFVLYGPNDPTCTGPGHSVRVVPVDHFGAPPYLSGPSNPITAVGTYTWVASYSGDANYLPTGPTACNDPAETFTVVPPTPTIVTQALPPSQLGGTSTDTAILQAPPGVTNPPSPAPTGSIVFRLYGPNDPTCSGPPHSTSTVPIDHFGPPTYVSAPAVIAAPGFYSWVATYSGDFNYTSAGTACNDPAESFAVAAPSIRVDKTASPLSRPAPGGVFTFTVVVTNTSSEPITITSLTDDIYGNLATRPGSTCGSRIGTTLPPGASSPVCSFTGSFMGTAGQSQTDVVTVVGHNATNVTVTDTDDAVVTITPSGPSGPSPIGVFRPSNGTWYLLSGPNVKWGLTGDVAVPADYNGDGTDDVAVFRPSTGNWLVRNGVALQWGIPGDIPVPADYTGDGIDDIAVFRPSNGNWYVRTGTGGVTVRWGLAQDVPVPGDYNGDGTDDIAVYRPTNGTWYVRTATGGVVVPWGIARDIPVPADYNGDGTDDIAVYRPATSGWYVRNIMTVKWGSAGDIPVPDDYDDNGTDDIAVFTPSTGVWSVRNGPSVLWGKSGDDPLPLPASIRERFFP